MKRIKFWAVYAWVMVTLGTAGCGTQARTPDEEVARQACLLKAEAESNKEADRRCPKTWTKCEHRPAVEAELKAKQEACR